MLQDKDINLLNELGCDTHFIEDKKVQEILYYEKKYNLNSFSILYSNDFTPEVTKWRKLVQEYIRLNGDITLINKVIPINLWGLSEQNKEKEYQMCDFIIHYQFNSAVMISNKNNLYKKVISLMNRHGIVVILYTNNIEDFELKQSNVVVVYTEKPNLTVAYNCTRYMLSYDTIHMNDYKLNDIKNKIVYI